jgi:iron complex outermembrane receptor protein
MRHFKLLPLPLLLLSLNTTAVADHLYLPAISVDGIGAEEAPYILPTVPVSTPDAGSMVKRLPGANINQNGPLTSIAQYRGLFSDRVNVLIDGVRISQAGPNRMDSPLSYIPGSRVNNVSVYRGIAPVSTGIETIGGTIVANSKQAQFANSENFEFHGDLTAGYADNGNSRYTGLNMSTANDTHRFQVAGSLDRGNDLEFDDGDIYPTEHERDTVGLNYGFQQDGNELTLEVEHHGTGKTGTPALPMDIIFARGENYKAAFKKSLANGDHFKARVNYQDADHLMSNHAYRMRMDAMKREAYADVISSGINLSYEHAAWTFGLDADQAEHNTDIANPTNAMFYVNNFNDVERDRYSVFADWNGNINDQWKLHSGARVSRVKTDAGEVDSSMVMMMPMVGTLRDRFNNADRSQEDTLFDLSAVFTYTVNENVDVEFGLARKERAPSYQERYLWLPMQSTSGLADGNNHVGNINLKPETAYQAELGLDWHTPKAGFSPRVFYHHINDYIQGVSTMDMPVVMISTMMGGDATPLAFDNVDAKLYGFDANWFVSINNNWQLDGTISYVRGERRDIDDNLYRIAPLTARTMLSYNTNDWRLGVEAETVAKQKHVSTTNEEQKTGGYVTFNLTGQYQVTDNMLVYAGVNNVFDRGYDNHLGGYNRVNNNSDIAQGDRLPGLGRSAFVSMNYTW